MRSAQALLFPGVMLALVVTALHAGAAGQSPVSPSGQVGPRFRSAVSLTTVNATVTDTEGRLVHDLPRDRFEVSEDGEPQVITQFTSERVPVSLAVLLDVSDSMYGRRMADAHGAIDRFVTELLDPSDEYTLMVFNHQQQLLASWTEDRSLLQQLSLVHPWGSTAIFDALMAAIPMADTRHKQRCALLVVSDGADTASDAGMRDLRRVLLRSDVFVYAIGIDSPDRRTINAPVNATTLAQITDQSGGRTRVVHDSSEVMLALEQIAEELRSQYLIGYTSPRGADGKYHSIRVRVTGGSTRFVRGTDMLGSPNP